jgi:hypothetical protein
MNFALPAREAREVAGFTGKKGLAKAAKLLRVTPAYLQRCEREGFSWPLANRAAGKFKAPITAFLPPRKDV